MDMDDFPTSKGSGSGSRSGSRSMLLLTKRLNMLYF